jgi:hypothetical protein
MKLFYPFIVTLILVLAAGSIPFVIRWENRNELLMTNEVLSRKRAMKAWEIGYKSCQAAGGCSYYTDSLEMAKVIFKK